MAISLLSAEWGAIFWTRVYAEEGTRKYNKNLNFIDFLDIEQITTRIWTFSGNGVAEW